MGDIYTKLNSLMPTSVNTMTFNADSQEVKQIVSNLETKDIKLRNDDGKLTGVTLSKPTTVSSCTAIVVGYTYEKKDNTFTEDSFQVDGNDNVKKYYKGKIEKKFP